MVDEHEEHVAPFSTHLLPSPFSLLSSPLSLLPSPFSLLPPPRGPLTNTLPRMMMMMMMMMMLLYYHDYRCIAFMNCMVLPNVLLCSPLSGNFSLSFFSGYMVSLVELMT